MTVPPLPEVPQSPTSCVLPANALVIVLARNSKCRVCIACQREGKDIKCGRVIPVLTLFENNGFDESDTDD